MLMMEGEPLLSAPVVLFCSVLSSRPSSLVSVSFSSFLLSPVVIRSSPSFIFSWSPSLLTLFLPSSLFPSLLYISPLHLFLHLSTPYWKDFSLSSFAVLLSTRSLGKWGRREWASEVLSVRIVCMRDSEEQKVQVKGKRRKRWGERMRRPRGSLLSFPLWRDRFPPAFDKGRDSLESLEEFMRMGNEMRKDELRRKKKRDRTDDLLPSSSFLFGSLSLVSFFSHTVIVCIVWKVGKVGKGAGGGIEKRNRRDDCDDESRDYWVLVIKEKGNEGKREKRSSSLRMKKHRKREEESSRFPGASMMMMKQVKERWETFEDEGEGGGEKREKLDDSLIRTTILVSRREMRERLEVKIGEKEREGWSWWWWDCVRWDERKRKATALRNEWTQQSLKFHHLQCVSSWDDDEGKR